MTRSAIELAREALTAERYTNGMPVCFIASDLFAICTALLALAEQNAAMVAVVNGAIESYRELGALDLRVGDVVDEDDVRCWEAHERAIGVPLRAYLTTPSPPATEQEK